MGEPETLLGVVQLGLLQLLGVRHGLRGTCRGLHALVPRAVAVHAVLVREDGVHDYNVRTGAARLLCGGPGGTHFAAAVCVVGDRRDVFVFGGTASMQSVFKFCLEDRVGSPPAWTPAAPMPTGRWGAAAIVRDGFVYLIGGGTQVVERFEPLTEAWAVMAPLQQTRVSCIAVESGGSLYCLSARGRAVERLQLTEGPGRAWQSLPTVGRPPEGRLDEGLSAACISGRIHVFGPDTSAVLDLQSLTWTRLPALPRRHGWWPGVAALPPWGPIYVFGDAVSCLADLGGSSGSVAWKRLPDWVQSPRGVLGRSAKGCYAAHLLVD